MLKLKVDKSKWICQKKLSDAEILSRRKPGTNQTHIGLYEGSVTLESVSIPSLLMYSNRSYDTITIMDPIETPDGNYRSPKARQGNHERDFYFEEKKYESTYQKISDIIKDDDDSSNRIKAFYIIWGSLTNGRLFFILYNSSQSSMLSQYLNVNEIFSNSSKGVTHSALHSKLCLLSEKLLENYYLEESILESSEQVKRNDQTSRFIPASDFRLIQKIGKLGEQLINNYLDEKKNKKEIRDYFWLSNINPGADHDFEITSLDGQIKMLEVKSTQSDFDTVFYWSKNERKLFLSNPKNYVIKRISNVFEKNKVSFRAGHNMISLSEKLNVNGINYGTATVSPDVVDINWDKSVILKKYYPV